MAEERKIKKEDSSSFIKRPSKHLKAKGGFFILFLVFILQIMHVTPINWCHIEIKIPDSKLAIFKDAIVIAQELDKEEIGKRNIELLFSKEIDPGSFLYTPQNGETIYSISRKFNMYHELLKEINGIEETGRLPRELKIVPGNFSIVIERKKNILTLYRDKEFFKQYCVGSGKDFSTPLGEYYIMSKLIKPPWIWKGKVITPQDPDYPLGTRWMGLSDTRLGIHGTKNPASIGEYISSGCIRMFNKDIEELFKIVPFGTKVIIKE